MTAVAKKVLFSHFFFSLISLAHFSTQSREFLIIQTPSSSGEFVISRGASERISGARAAPAWQLFRAERGGRCIYPDYIYRTALSLLLRRCAQDLISLAGIKGRRSLLKFCMHKGYRFLLACVCASYTLSLDFLLRYIMRTRVNFEKKIILFFNKQKIIK